MSRSDNKSLLIRGVPRELLERLHQLAHNRGAGANVIISAIVEAYADERITPTALPPAFDVGHKSAAPHQHQGTVAISGLDNDVFARFMARAKRDGWLSKNGLIIALLQDQVDQAL
jgi:hypothetical protein